MKSLFVYEDGKLIEKPCADVVALSYYLPFSCECTKTGMGIAVDLGTTTIVIQLVDLSSGKVLRSVAEANNQARYGADIVSRIAACKTHGLQKLTDIIRKQLCNMINSLIINEKKCGREIAEIAIGGNTTMLHLLMGADPSSIGEYPYIPKFTSSIVCHGAQIGLPVKTATLLPSVSGYIGGDIVAGLLNLVHTVGNYLLIDLGTNGELVLKYNDKYYCASTAVGPAFEGGSIECGVGGIGGAICHVNELDGALALTTVEDKPPCGICGSGLIDIIAYLLKFGIIDKSGAFVSVTERFHATSEIYISQKDVRQYQLAKSAVYSAIMTLLNVVNADIDKIDYCFLAGGAGFYLSPANAKATGLLPNFKSAQIKAVGNSCLAGTTLFLLGNKQNDADEIVKKCAVVSLADNPDFQNHFLNNLNFN